MKNNWAHRFRLNDNGKLEDWNTPSLDGYHGEYVTLKQRMKQKEKTQ